MDAEVEGIVTTEFERAEALLGEHHALLDALVELLLEKKVLDRAALDGAINKQGEQNG